MQKKFKISYLKYGNSDKLFHICYNNNKNGDSMATKKNHEEQNTDSIQLALDLITRDTEVKPKAKVKLGNEIINARYDLKNKQTKLWFAIISQIKEDDDNFCVYRFKARDLATAIGIPLGRGYFSEIRSYLNQLRKKDITLQTRVDEDEEKEKWIDASFISSVEATGDGYMEIAIDRKLKKYFFELKKQYTKIGVQQILTFQSSYTSRIYGFIKQYETTGYRKMKIDDLKNMLMIENKYKLAADLKRYVLNPAVEEINSKTNFHVEYECNGGRGKGKTTEVIFKFYKRNTYAEKLTNDELDLYNELSAAGIKDEKLKEIFELYDFERIKNNFDYALKCDTTSLNKSGFIIAAITNNYIEKVHAQKQTPEEKNKERVIQVLKNLRELDEENKIKIYNEVLENTTNLVVKEKMEQLKNLENALENPIIKNHIVNKILEKIDKQN